MAPKKKARRVRLRVQPTRCKRGWHVKFARRSPTEDGGLEPDEVVRIVSINYKTRTIVVMPGSPPCEAHMDVFRPHE